MIGRHELNRVLFLCVPEREIDIQKGMEIQRSPPLFSRTSRDKGGKGGFFVLTFASFQRNEPRGKWKSRTNGVEDNRPWKRPKRPLLSSCRPEYRLFSFLLEEEEGRSVYSPSFSPVEILLYDAATTSAIRIFIRTTLKALTSDERGGRGVFNSAIGCFYARVRKLHLSFSIDNVCLVCVWFVDRRPVSRCYDFNLSSLTRRRQRG